MKTLTNERGSKFVRITKDFRCLYGQIYNSEEQVLESKKFKSEKVAIKYANKKLE